MKVTQKMIDTFREFNPGARNIAAGLAAALADAPDMEPFTYAGYAQGEVFIHPCITVCDARVDSGTMNGIRNGDCDCESGAPWQRIYVRRAP